MNPESFGKLLSRLIEATPSSAFSGPQQQLISEFFEPFLFERYSVKRVSDGHEQFVSYRLTEAQAHFRKVTDTKFVVLGHAGTGKTICALDRAERLSQDEKALVYVVFPHQRVIDRFLLEHDVLRRQNVKVFALGDFLAKFKAGELHSSAHLIIDEGQDFPGFVDQSGVNHRLNCQFASAWIFCDEDQSWSESIAQKRAWESFVAKQEDGFMWPQDPLCEALRTTKPVSELLRRFSGLNYVSFSGGMDVIWYDTCPRLFGLSLTDLALRSVFVAIFKDIFKKFEGYRAKDFGIIAGFSSGPTIVDSSPLNPTTQDFLSGLVKDAIPSDKGWTVASLDDPPADNAIVVDEPMKFRSLERRVIIVWYPVGSIFHWNQLYTALSRPLTNLCFVTDKAGKQVLTSGHFRDAGNLIPEAADFYEYPSDDVPCRDLKSCVIL